MDSYSDQSGTGRQETFPIEISVADLEARLREQVVGQATTLTVLDVREAVEVETCEIAGSVHMPMMDVPARFTELPDDHALVVLCHHGMRSAQVVGFLREQGYANAINLKGGIDAWAREIDHTMATY